MARSINNTVRTTTEHMDDARGLDTLLASTTAAQTSMKTGTGGRFWSDPTAFGFDMDVIDGMKQQTDDAMQAWIEGAMEGGGGDVDLAPPDSDRRPLDDFTIGMDLGGRT